jgi:peptidoglycan/LPS O-acetylase OafA/YrhL
MLDILRKGSFEFDLRSNAFDFIRLVLAIVVVFYHSGEYGGFGMKYSSMYYYNIRDWDINFANLGSIAVYGFFVISGFLITGSSINSSSSWSFLVKRFKRIYPAYLVSLVFVCFVFVPIILLLTGHLYGLKGIVIQDLEYFWRNLFVEMKKITINGLFVDTDITQGVKKDGWLINGSYWTLIHEFRAYILILVLSLVGFLRKKYPVLVLAVLLNILYVIGVISPSFRGLMDIITTDFRLLILFSYFVMGSVFYLYKDKIIWSYQVAILALIGLLMGIYINIFALFGVVCGCYLLLFVSQIIPIKNISKRFGDISYGVYIYSTPLQFLLFYVGAGKLGFLVYFLLSLVLACIAGFASYHLVEKRFLVRR